MTALVRGSAITLLFVSSVTHASEFWTPALMEKHKGGTLQLVARSAAGTIDPQINYTSEFWQIYQFVYDGLVAFKKGPGNAGSELVPDLAVALPMAKSSGKTYVFKLRKGIKFSNGQPVTVSDVVASFQRIFKVSSPTSGTFYNNIVGADKCLKTPATCTLAGGVVADATAGTITFHLTQPDSEFFDKLALPHAAILPASTPDKDAGTTPIPGTGPYMIANYNPNTEMKIVRNPYFKQWSVDAQPIGYVDAMVYHFGLTDEAEVTEVENGQADWMFDQPPTDRLGEIGTRYAKQVHVSPLEAIWYAPMNTRLAPFNNVKARQALSYAINRKAVVNLFGGPRLGEPSCQILPPGFPGYEPYCPYTKNPGATWSAPNMAKAKQLVQESGTAGEKVTLIVEDTAVSRAIGTYLQSVLNELGYQASVKAISPNIEFTYIQNTKNKVQISLTQWYQDYPAASDFLNVLFSCDAFHPGSDSSVNISGFCDPKIDVQMQHAMKVAITDLATANKLWAKIDKQVTEQAPAAILFNPKHIDFVSSRVGNYMYSSQRHWVMSQAWVK
ncbi:peptide ABC transporter substrate-binding protein [Acidihalobacter yilgarnensis]|uniref:Peptide ABC transporter substrate-binding protein n=2 Tax=Acidihalobacter yilgarnensis TaxID=2819280 RepID=A0A1D8INW1_9GAMM|nr:peptide ABC transporter substrate-binding protein [Acidihalobacter yilgarnensis]